jgi:hypothetical protein
MFSSIIINPSINIMNNAPHLNPLPKGRGRKRKLSKIPSHLRERVWVRVKLNHIWKPIPSNRIAINLVLPLIITILKYRGYI